MGRHGCDPAKRAISAHDGQVQEPIISGQYVCSVREAKARVHSFRPTSLLSEGRKEPQWCSPRSMRVWKTYTSSGSFPIGSIRGMFLEVLEVLAHELQHTVQHSGIHQEGVCTAKHGKTKGSRRQQHRGIIIIKMGVVIPGLPRRGCKRRAMYLRDGIGEIFPASPISLWVPP